MDKFSEETDAAFAALDAEDKNTSLLDSVMASLDEKIESDPNKELDDLLAEIVDETPEIQLPDTTNLPSYRDSVGGILDTTEEKDKVPEKDQKPDSTTSDVMPVMPEIMKIQERTELKVRSFRRLS